MDRDVIGAVVRSGESEKTGIESGSYFTDVSHAYMNYVHRLHPGRDGDRFAKAQLEAELPRAVQRARNTLISGLRKLAYEGKTGRTADGQELDYWELANFYEENLNKAENLVRGAAGLPPKDHAANKVEWSPPPKRKQSGNS